MPTFGELIEARARELYEAACPGRAWARAFTASHFRQEAREALILEWAEANPEAAGRLIEGRAAVVPFPAHLAPGPVPELDAKTERSWRPLVELTRLDSSFTPKR